MSTHTKPTVSTAAKKRLIAFLLYLRNPITTWKCGGWIAAKWHAQCGWRALDTTVMEACDEACAHSSEYHGDESDVFAEDYEGKPRGEFGTNAGDELAECDTYESIAQLMIANAEEDPELDRLNMDCKKPSPHVLISLQDISLSGFVWDEDDMIEKSHTLPSGYKLTEKGFVHFVKPQDIYTVHCELVDILDGGAQLIEVIM